MKLPNQSASIIRRSFLSTRTIRDKKWRFVTQQQFVIDDFSEPDLHIRLYLFVANQLSML